jgi:hypothetical protein
MAELGDAMSTGPNEGLSAGAAMNAKLRKRTKTGCLTCRKRRIKCGEERPTCNNCIKSKRHCEGYNQRVIFKPPMGDWPGLQASTTGTIPYHNGMLPAAAPFQRTVPPPINTQDAGFTPLQPRPMYRQTHNEANQHVQFSPSSAGAPYMTVPYGFPMPSPQTPLPPAWTPITPQYGHPMFPPQESPMSAGTYHSFPSQLPTPLGPPSQFFPSPDLDQGWQQTQQSNGLGSSQNQTASSNQDFKPLYAEPTLPTPGASNLSQEGEAPQFPFRAPDGYWDQANVEFITVNTDVTQQPQHPQQSPEGDQWSDRQSVDVKPVLPRTVSSKLLLQIYQCFELGSTQSHQSQHECTWTTPTFLFPMLIIL